MSRVACPYCCTIQTFPDGLKCKQCASVVPEKYLNLARTIDPVYLTVVGMTSHGKTTYLQSLTHAMDNLGKISSGALLDALDDATLKNLGDMRKQIATRTENTPTVLRSNEVVLQIPSVFSLKSFMAQKEAGKDRNLLVMYDIGGEVFKDRKYIAEFAAPFKLAYTVWFMVSLHDLEHENKEYSTIADVFNVYAAGMEAAGARTQNRKLHVIYTKADKLTNTLPGEVLEYIRDDPYHNLGERKPSEFKGSQFVADDYHYKLKEMSSRLEDFTLDDVPGGIQFINMARDYGMELSFSINTAIGRDHDRTMSNRMIDYEAYRVLDPLVWALDSHVGLQPQAAPSGGIPTLKSMRTRIILILDTSPVGKTKIYGTQLPSHLFTTLSDMGDVETYYTGTLTPMTKPGYEPSDNPPTKDTMSFVGPILDQLDANALVVVVTSRNIDDLPDFHNDEWHRRIGIVTFEKPYEVRRNDPWPQSVVYDRSRTAAEQVKDLVKKLFSNR